MSTTPFTETYEQISLAFDQGWADSQFENENDDKKYIDLIARDGNGRVYISLSREQAAAMCDKLQEVVAQQDAWLETRQASAADATSTTEQENQ